MKITPFETEHFFARYEFTTPYLLSVSDCESMTVGDLLEASGWDNRKLTNLRLGYTESQGNPELRAAVARAYETVSDDEVIILGSPIEGIYLTLRALLEPDDQAIVLVPAYDALINITEHICKDVQRWPLKEAERGWKLDFDILERLIGVETRLIIVNFPHNPTGFLPSHQEFTRLINIARERGIWLYSDEMYRGLEYHPDDRLSSAADLYDRSVVLSGLSKTHGLPGLRSGWLVVKDEEVRNGLINWKHYTSICPAAPSELLALAALEAGTRLPDRSRSIIHGNLKLAEIFFSKWEQFFRWRPPQAGSVALVGIDVPSAASYCHKLARDAGVLLLPSKFMGYDDRHVRFGFGRRSFSRALDQYDNYLEKNLRMTV
jgi:aspartate/methionine/tyrosine aminotransferase